jgi:hypothetical protein
MPREIEKKVADYLRDSQALEDYWQKPITPEQLQAEMTEWRRIPSNLTCCGKSSKRWATIRS